MEELFRPQSNEFQKRAQNYKEEFFQLKDAELFYKKVDGRFYFSVAEKLTLWDQEKRKIQIDFDHRGSAYFRKGLGKNDLLLKAIGYGRGTQSVLDLTAGLLVDTVHFLQVGLTVTALERNPFIYFLLKKSIESSERTELFSRLTLLYMDSLSYFEKLENSFVEQEAIYYDPMYPEKKKSALPKQEMVLFHELIGGDLDSGEVFQQAFLKKRNRLVIKRHPQHPPLGMVVQHSFIGKAVCYDYY